MPVPLLSWYSSKLVLFQAESTIYFFILRRKLNGIDCRGNLATQFLARLEMHCFVPILRKLFLVFNLLDMCLFHGFYDNMSYGEDDCCSAASVYPST
jgi:hypothetical protein